MEQQSENLGFNVPKQDISIGDQADIYLTIHTYDSLKYGFCDKYDYRLAESALALKKCGDDETVIYDGVQTKKELSECYTVALEVALAEVPLDDHTIWIEQFQRELNEVHEMAVQMGMQGYKKE